MSDAIEQIDEAEVDDLELEPGVEDGMEDDLGADVHDDPETEQAIADAEAEGLPPVPEVAPEDQDERDISIATEKAMQELFSIQDKLDAAIGDHAAKAEVANNAKAWVKVLQENLSSATKRLREARTKSEPDPGRYPLLDGRKAEVNGMFPKPEAIAALPADTAEEFYRRKGRDTRLDSLGLPRRAVAALAKAGYHTYADVGKLTEASAPLTSVAGIGKEAAGAIINKFGDVTAEWVKEWSELHPEPEAAAEEGGEE